MPTTITTQSYRVTSDWASRHKDTLLQWLQLHSFRSQSERRHLEQWTVSGVEDRYTKHAQRDAHEIYTVLEPSRKATHVTPAS